MHPKTLAIIGATGQQGRSVISYVLRDPALSAQYPVIRALTRDPNSLAAKNLISSSSSPAATSAHTPSRIELVEADLDSPSSVTRGLAGAHTLFLVTVPSFDPDPTLAIETEFQAAKRAVDAAAGVGVEHVIFSTLPSYAELSGGKYPGVTPFEAKWRVERYIRDLCSSNNSKGTGKVSFSGGCAFFAAGSFMQNFGTQGFLAPRKQQQQQEEEEGEDVYVVTRPHPWTAKMPLLDAVGDAGKFVGAMLADPGRFSGGETLCAATRLYSLEEIVGLLSKATGKRIVYREVGHEEFADSLPVMGEGFAQYLEAVAEVGYFGPRTEELVAQAAECALGGRDGLMDFEKFLMKNPPLMVEE